MTDRQYLRQMRKERDFALAICGRQVLSSAGVRAELFPRYLMFLRRAAKLRGEASIPHADKVLMLRTWIASVEAKGLDPVVLRRLLKDVLSLRVG